MKQNEKEELFTIGLGFGLMVACIFFLVVVKILVTLVFN